MIIYSNHYQIDNFLFFKFRLQHSGKPVLCETKVIAITEIMLWKNEEVKIINSAICNAEKYISHYKWQN